MIRLGEWLWARHRVRFLAWVGVLVFVMAVLGFVAPGFVLIGIMFHLSLGETVSIIGAASAAVGIGVAFGVLAPVQIRREIRGWARGDRSDPDGAWNATLRCSQLMTTYALAMQALVHLAITIPLFARWAGLSSWGTVFFALTLFNGEIAAGLLIAMSFTLLMRPVLDEIAVTMPNGPTPNHPQWSLQGRFLVGFGVWLFVATVYSPAVSESADTPEGRFIAAFLMAAALGSYLVLILRAGLVRPSFRPLGDLMDAARRVREGNFADPVAVTSADEFGDLAVAFNEMQVGLRERESLQAAFGSYVDPALALRLLESGSDVFDGEELDLTVMFADVRSFTAYSEGVSPTDAVGLLNRLFDVMVPILHEHGGHANHYLGDGLLAVFGAPLALPHHADDAVAAAVDIQRQVRAVLGDELRIGIGINTGPVIAGTVGGGGRLEFTVIGDTVNAAARVEGLTKETGDAILITEATRLALSAPRPRSTKRGDFEVRGKATKLTLHAINPFPRTAKRSTR